MTTPNLRELFDLAQENVERIFRETGEISPMWHAIFGKNEHALIPTPWCNDEEKREAVDAIKCLFAAVGVKRYVFITEAWSLVTKDLKEARNVRPSQHPDRRETLRIHAEDRDGTVLAGHYFILRPEHGPPVLSPFHEDPPDMVMKGRMTGLLI